MNYIDAVLILAVGTFLWRIIVASERRQTERTNDLAKQVAAMERRHTERMDEMAKQVAAMDRRHTERMDEMAKQMTEMGKQMAAMVEQMTGMDRRHTERMDEMAKQVAAMERRHTERMNAMANQMTEMDRRLTTDLRVVAGILHNVDVRLARREGPRDQALEAAQATPEGLRAHEAEPGEAARGRESEARDAGTVPSAETTAVPGGSSAADPDAGDPRQS